jgi:diaminohydroxyphosphoribosylaminopyrimidine deaminase / 5-amino-6-(5-phosphoribosylamino)uracil reductase
MENDEKYMHRCIELALMGRNQVAPNPMVGSVIVLDNQIIGEGYHKKFGEAHAEVNAIQSVSDKSCLSKATIYVNLEPCAHYGKTPPCADLILQHRFKKVVIGCVDTFSEVAGKGIEKLRKAGIQVEVGILEEACQALNKRFFTYHTFQRPYIILKWAQSQDGFMDILRPNNEKGIAWITSPETKALVHTWRSEEAAILVGRNTVEVDNPSLTVRYVSGKNPIRIILDPNLSLTEDLSLFQDGEHTLVFNQLKTNSKGNVKWIQLSDYNLKNLLNKLYQEGISSVIIEGGKRTLEYFIKENIWDEARILIGQTNLSNGLKAPILNRIPEKKQVFFKDFILYYKNTKSKEII